SYLQVPPQYIVVSTIAVICLVGLLNYYGPKHSGSVAVALALPTMFAVIAIIILSIPHLTTKHLHPLSDSWGHTWVAFVGVILALSGVEAVANLTGIMRPDRSSSVGNVTVGRTSFKAILPVALEVSVGTALLGWAMLSLPESLKPVMRERKEDMLRFLGEHYATINFNPVVGKYFGWFVGGMFALLLLSAVNTAVAAMIGLLFTTARDREMPASFASLNRHGVPWAPLAIAVGLPAVVLLMTNNFESLAGLYAIGVVGAICVNLGSCTFNFKLDINIWERLLLGFTFFLLVAVELTLAKTKPDALFFVLCVLIVGLMLRAYTQKRSGIETLTVSSDVARIVRPEAIAAMKQPAADTQKIMVCVRGITPVLRYAFDEAQLRNACLYVFYVQEIAVLFQGGRPLEKMSWKNDPVASAILSTAIQIGHERGISVIPLYATSTNAAAIIVDTAATIGADYLMLGASHRDSLSKLLRGNVLAEVASSLPESIQLVICG
ncbi:MAG: amino acid permease, partial [Chthoniobacterales bacterium]